MEDGHDCLQIIDVGEEEADVLEELLPSLGQVIVHHDFQVVREVVVAMETDPVNALI